MKRLVPLSLVLGVLAGAAWTAPASGAEMLQRADVRFAAETQETPDFRRHVVPLLGKLGCNGRACHGSFQGQGGFQLSLFGYDFVVDHQQMTGGDEPRVDAEFPDESLILEKATLTMPHKGGKRMDVGSWEHRILLEWIKQGAAAIGPESPDFAGLEVTPSEIVFAQAGETVQLKVIARWSDGSREDVTPLTRFQSNDEQVAAIDDNGLVTAADPGDSHVVVFYDNGVVPIPVIRPVSGLVGPKYPKVETPTPVDELVVQKLRKMGIVQSETAGDADFLRRVSLDMTGTLPTPQETAAFLADASPDKRARKIDELLERPAYAAWWATKLCDVTGNNPQLLNNITPIQNRATQEWYEWIHQRVADNTPYDQLVEGIVTAVSRNKGESFLEYSENMSAINWRNSDARYADRESMPHYWARRTFRSAEDRVVGFAYTFMGIRIQCAQCHKHPFDQWTQDDFEQFKGFFTRTSIGVNPASRREYNKLIEKLELGELRGNMQRREIGRLLNQGKVVPFQEVYAQGPRGNARNPGNRNRGARGQSIENAKLLGAEEVDLTKYEDARTPLMEWLRREDNPYFAKAFVNRVWASYFNVGIVEPPDDLSLANPPSNQALLDYLAEGFIRSGFDMKWLHREIANSRTYQLSWKPNDTNIHDERNFSRSVPRRLPAEVAYDAIVQATSSDEEIERLHREVEGRAIAFVGQRNNQNYALTIFGRSTRESNCDCDRSSEASLLQTVFLQNDNEVLSLINRGRGGWLAHVRQEVTGQAPRAEAANPQRGGQNAQVQRIRARLRQMRQEGNTQAVRRLQARLAELTKDDAEQAQPARPRQAPEDRRAAQASQAPMDTEELVRQAYLRTLSRMPNDEELQRSSEYVAQADDSLAALRDVLWALLNTKEFIVNH